MKEFIKNTLRENIKTNSIGVEITRPNQVLDIMRGIPGAGKSTKAKTLVKEGVIHSTDDVIESTGDYRLFFETMKASGNFGELHKAHSTNLKNAKKSMTEGITPIVIDNTNIKANEAKQYVLEALKLGYDDVNIRITDVGTGGATAEVLAGRNKHGVPLDKIEQMMKAYESTGPLTLKKILESKDMFKPKQVKILYSAVVLTENSRSRILEALAGKIPSDWDVFAHHMTIIFGKELPADMKHLLGKEVELNAYALGKSDLAMALKVTHNGVKVLTQKQAHITIAVNTKEGGKPVMAGEIKQWKEILPFKLTGIVTEVKSNS